MFAGLCLVATLVAGVAPVQADTAKKNALALYKAGIVARDAGDLDKACVSFQLSVNTRISPDALLEAAACRARDDDATGALGLYDQAIARAKTSTKAPTTSAERESWRRVAAVARTKGAALKTSRGVVVINTKSVPAGAWVAYAVNDKPIELARVTRPLLLSPGKHVFAANRPGCGSFRVTKNVRAGSTYKVTVPKLACKTNAILGKNKWRQRYASQFGPRGLDPDWWLVPNTWRRRGTGAIMAGIGVLVVGVALQFKFASLADEARECRFTTLTCDPVPIEDTADIYSGLALGSFIGSGVLIVGGILMRYLGGGPAHNSRGLPGSPARPKRTKANLALRPGGAVFQFSRAF